MSIEKLRNIAIVAHVDHGKTTLVDQLLKQSGTFSERTVTTERMMDSNDLEKERGITILSKNTAIRWKSPAGEEYRINIVDTPGHADFGGEVERVLSMVDSVLILVDAMDGPMPQTRFVTQKAFAMGFKPIVVVNKVDRPGARPDWVLDQTFDLFDRLGATDEQLDFPTVYASALNGYAGLEPDVRSGDMTPLFQTIIDHVSPPPVDLDGPFQMRITTLGLHQLRRHHRHRPHPARQGAHQHAGLDRSIATARCATARSCRCSASSAWSAMEVTEANAGDIVAITGIEDLSISDTVCALDAPEQLPVLTVDEPTISMTFQVNNSPFAGVKDRSGGKFLTTRQLRDRLMRETHAQRRAEGRRHRRRRQVQGQRPRRTAPVDPDRNHASRRLRARRVAPGSDRQGDRRRQDASRSRALVVDLEEQYQGGVMQRLGERRAQLTEHGAGRQGPRAHRLHDPGARADRLPDRVPHALPPAPACCSTCSITYGPQVRGRHRRAPERRDDLQRHRSFAGLRADR